MRRRGVLVLAAVTIACGSMLAAAVPADATATGGPAVMLTPTKVARANLRPSLLLGFVRDRLAQLGIDGARASRHGDDILVQFPNGTDTTVAQALVARLELTFRPVLAQLPPPSAGV